MTYDIAIDFGGSTTKLIVTEEQRIVQRRLLPAAARPEPDTLHALIATVGLRAQDVSTLFVTGGLSRHLPRTVEGIRLQHVGEVESIGRGGSRAASVTE